MKKKLVKGNLLAVVEEVLRKRTKILQLAQKHPTPFYLFDQANLQTDIKHFVKVFRQNIPSTELYYAVKSNPHPWVIKEVLRVGEGVDVSSGKELSTVLNLGAEKIIFTGPGKTIAELTLAVKNSKRVTVNIDSFRELEKLGELSERYRRKIRAGVRVYTSYHGNWSKFGIALSRLNQFWQQAEKYPFVELMGIQCHMSYNLDELPYQQIIRQLGDYLKNSFNKKFLPAIKYIDVGGGFLPYRQEACYDAQHKYYLVNSVPLEQYAKGIAEAISKYLDPLVKCSYFFEPGRVISMRSMHIVLRVVDVKSKKSAIMDGGVNIIGWTSPEPEHMTLINLTHVSRQERRYLFYGSLCTPADIWGYYYYGRDVKEEDIFVIPNQGAYAYTFAQNFIKTIPPVYKL